jgi:hypothetical protein
MQKIFWGVYFSRYTSPSNGKGIKQLKEGSLVVTRAVGVEDDRVETDVHFVKTPMNSAD